MPDDPTSPRSPSEAPTASRPPSRPGAPSTPLPRTIGPYTVKSLIASGGMGDVYECRDERLGRDVAVKVPRPDIAADPALMAQVLEEGRRLASVKNTAYIARILAAGDATIEGVTVPFIALEFEPGAETLGGPRSAAWPIARKVELFTKICRAVEALHEQHLVHADIKPSNILVVGDEPRLIDFGIARIVRRFGGEAGQMLAGTPGYLDPAAASGAGGLPDQRTDIYALGVTLAAFLTGRSPDDATAGRWPSSDRPASRECADIDAELDAIILRCVDPDLSRRFQSAARLDERLREWLTVRDSLSARLADAARRELSLWSRRAARRPLLVVPIVAALTAAIALALSPALFLWTFIAGAAQPLEKSAASVGPALQSVRIVEMTDAGASLAALGPAGADIPLGVAGSERLLWARLARKLASAGGARAVAFDLMFRDDYPRFDPELRDAFAALGPRTEARRVLVGLHRWDAAPFFSAAGGNVLSACTVINDAEPDHPPTLQLAVAHPDSSSLTPSFALTLAAMSLRPGSEFRLEGDQSRGTVRLVFQKPSGAGSQQDLPDPYFLTGLDFSEPIPQERADNGIAPSDRVVRFPCELASDADIARATIDAAGFLAMTDEQVRGWVTGRTVIFCDARPDKDNVFKGRQGRRRGAFFQASSLQAMLVRDYLKLPSWGQAGLITLLGTLFGAGIGWCAAAPGRGRNVPLFLTLTSLSAFTVAISAAAAVLWGGAASRYLVNPAVVAIAAAAACAALAWIRHTALAAESR